MQVHEIQITTAETLAIVSVDDDKNTLSILAGKWPILQWDGSALQSVLVDVPEVTDIGLTDVTVVYLSWPDGDGDVHIDLASQEIGYGYSAVAKEARNPEADMLAWYDGTEWHVKKLVAIQPEPSEEVPDA